MGPLADVFAYSNPDPSVMGVVRSRLKAAPEFTTTWEPAPGWISALAPLPGGHRDTESAQRSGLAFGEGSHLAGDPEAVALKVDAGGFDLGGDVGLVRFRTGGNATVVRSAAGLVPWYVYSGGRSVAVATRMTDLVRFLTEHLAIDPLPAALWASNQLSFPDRRTFLVGVDAVAPGTAVTVRSNGSKNHVRWWDPWQRSNGWPSERLRREHVAEFREAVTGALGDGIDRGGGNLLTLSGGVDSTLLAALIAGHLGVRLSALSFMPDGNETSFRREWSYLRPIVEEFVTPPHITYPLGTGARCALAGRGPRVAFPVLHPALQVLPEVIDQTGASVLVGGEFADEICGGRHLIPDWLEVVGPTSLLRLSTRRRLGVMELRRWGGRVIRRRPMPTVWPESLADFVRPSLNVEFQAWRHEQLRLRAADDRPYRHLRSLLVGLEGATAMNWEACSALRVRRLFPFLTRQTMEIVAACHPAELIGPGVKRLQRQAFAGLAPARNLERPDKGQFGTTRGDGVTVVSPPAPPLLASVVRDDIIERDTELGVVATAGLRNLVGFAQNVSALRAGAGNHEGIRDES